MGRASRLPLESERPEPRAGRRPRRPEPMPQSISTRQLWKPLLVAAAVAFAYSGVLARLGRFWWEDENYSHGLLVPFVVGYMLWAGREKLAGAAARPRVFWGAGVVVAALLALWVGTAGAELFTQ